MLPDDSSRLTALTRAFAPLVRFHFLPRAGSEVGVRDGILGAATLWDPPGQRKPSTFEQIVTTPTMLWAFRSRVPASARVMELMEEHHRDQPHPAGPAFVVPRAAADADPTRVVAVVFLAGQHQTEQSPAVTTHHQHRPVLAPRRVVLVDHPRPHDLAGIGAAVEVRGVHQL